MPENLYLKLHCCYITITYCVERFPIRWREVTGGRRRTVRKESLPNFPGINYVIFSLQGKCVLGEARLAAVRLAWGVCWDQWPHRSLWHQLKQIKVRQDYDMKTGDSIWISCFWQRRYFCLSTACLLLHHFCKGPVTSNFCYSNFLIPVSQ